MEIKKYYLTKNRCYQQNVKRTPIGIQLHTIGTAQGTAKSVADYWNQSSVSACTTYIVDCDSEDIVYQLLPEDVYSWADAGYGNKNLITFEICESDYMKYTSGASFTVTNSDKFKSDITRGYNTAVKLCADICQRYGWNPTDKLPSGLYVISSHDEGRLAGLSSSHVDPTHVWPYINKTMDIFREDVKAVMGNTSSSSTATSETVYYRVRKTWEDEKSQLGAYTSLENAKNACPSGYSVFDEDGNAVYTPAVANGTQASEFANLTEAEAAEKILEMCKLDYEKTGILASVSAAQMILESGYVKTELATKANNCFGMKKTLSGNTWENSTWDEKSVITIATKEEYTVGTITTINAEFRKYPCIEDSIGDHSAYLLGAMNGTKKRYDGLTKCSNYTEAITLIKNGGYATDSQYVSKICNIIERFNLNRYDKVSTSESTSSTVETKTQTYRVRLKWGTDMTTQIGAYTNLQNAIDCADRAVVGYKVFDEDGKIIYNTGELTAENQCEIAVQWAEKIADDDSHGYDNRKNYRGGNPDYACSSFVNEAYRQAGVDLPESSTVYTSKMKSIYTEKGFKDVTSKVTLKTGKGLEIGDVVLKPGKHVEIYSGNGKLVGARGNANSGKAENGKSGDQTGAEIAVCAYFNYPWTVVLRYVGNETKQETTASTTTSTTTSVTYTVQAGSFSYKANATKLMNSIKAKGIEAIVKQVGKEYKVQCGAFSVKANAEKRVEQLKALGFSAILKEE